MAMPEYWDSGKVCEFLGIKRNNLDQIVMRMRNGHELAGHKSDKCSCLLVDHKGHGVNWFRADRVQGYALYRKGAPSTISQVISIARAKEKSQPVGKKSIGRPTNKIQGETNGKRSHNRSASK